MENNAFVYKKGAVHVLPEIDTSAIPRKFLDISYAGDSEFQKFDLFLPNEGDGPFPLIVFFHGGGWRCGDKRDIQVRSSLKLLKRGYAVASANWRLSFEARFPACVMDCKAVVRYIKAHAAELKVDPNRIALAGGSAGGHLALMMATTEGCADFEDLTMGNAEQSTAVRCVIAWFPVTDLLTEFSQAAENEKNGIINTSDNSRDYDDPEAPEALLLGGAISALTPEYVKWASPVYHISEKMPPVLLQHGKVDFHVPCQQSIEFYDKAKQVLGDGRVELDLFDTAIHMGTQFETGKNMERVATFLEKHMKQASNKCVKT